MNPGEPRFAPGWYPEGPHLRWWDGSQWGPYATGGPVAPPQSEIERGRMLALLGHLVGLLALILYLMEKDKPDRNRYLCHHACEAINHQITFMVVWVVGVVAFFATGVASIMSAGPDGHAGFPTAVFVVWGVMVVLGMVNLVIAIVAAVRTYQGVWWRYPLTIRLVGRGIDWQNA